MANEGHDGVRFVRASLDQCATCRKVSFFAVLDSVTTDKSVELLREYARQDSPAERYLVSRGGTILTNLLLGTKLREMASGFELFSHKVLSMVRDRGIHSRAHFFQTEIRVYCRNLRIAEVPIHYRSPSPRLGSFAVKDALHQLWRLVKLRWTDKLPEITTDDIREVPGCNLYIGTESRSK